MTFFRPFVLFICFCMLIPVMTASAQDELLLTIQRESAGHLEAAWNTFWSDCNSSIARPIRDTQQASRYLQCIIGNLPDVIRTWQDAQSSSRRNVLLLVEQFFENNLPTGEPATGQIQNIQGIAAFAFQTSRVWHQKQAELVLRLREARVIVAGDAEELLEQIQVSMNKSTAAARLFIDKTGPEAALDSAGIKQLYTDLLSDLDTNISFVVEQLQRRLMQAVTRTKQQYGRLLAQESTNVEVFIENYDAFFLELFEALKTNLQHQWVETAQ